MFRRSLVVALVAAGLGVLTPASGHASLLWLGVSGGRTRLTGEPDVTSVGAVLGADVPLIPFLNLEAGYQRLNTVQLQLVTGAALLRVPILPEVHILARLGVAQLSGTGGNPTASRNDPLYGAGVSVRLASPVSVRGEYQVVHDRTLGNIKTVLGSIVYHF